MKKAFLILIISIFSICYITAFAEESMSISFDDSCFSIPIGKSITLKTTISPKKNLKLEWFSSNEEVASVTSKGIVKGLTVGETTITVHSVDNPEVNAACTVHVVIPVRKIVFAEKEVKLAPAFVYRLKATIEPNDATNHEIIWSSSNPKIALVSKNGVVTGISKGTAKITAESTDGSKVKASVNIKVDEYGLVLSTPFTQQTSYSISGNGNLRVRGSVKNKNVSISDVDQDLSIWGNGYFNHDFYVTPLKAGTDTITIKASGKTLRLNVLVLPDAFKLQNLGFGEGAVVEPGTLGVFEGHTYQIFNDKCPWTEAKGKCESIGGHLVTINSENEQKYLELLNYQNNTLWIGLVKDTTSNTWSWITDEKTIYTNWADGEPNDYATREYPYENVVGIRPEWNDLHEENTADITGYVCEWDDITIDVEPIEVDGTIDIDGTTGHYDGHKYQICLEQCSWQKAKEKCEAMGGHLVTLATPEEVRLIQRMNKDNYNLWIGLYKDNEENWKWITDEIYSLTYWNDGEPNNFFLREFPFENVVAMKQGWNDYHEDNYSDISGFVCEWESDNE